MNTSNYLQLAAATIAFDSVESVGNFGCPFGSICLFFVSKY